MKCLAGKSPLKLNWESCQDVGWDLRSKMCWGVNLKNKVVVQGICHGVGALCSGPLWRIRISLESEVSAPNTGQSVLVVCHSLIKSLLLDQRNSFPMNISSKPMCLGGKKKKLKNGEMVFSTKQTHTASKAIPCCPPPSCPASRALLGPARLLELSPSRRAWNQAGHWLD